MGYLTRAESLVLEAASDVHSDNPSWMPLKVSWEVPKRINEAVRSAVDKGEEEITLRVMRFYGDDASRWFLTCRRRPPDNTRGLSDMFLLEPRSIDTLDLEEMLTRARERLSRSVRWELRKAGLRDGQYLGFFAGALTLALVGACASVLYGVSFSEGMDASSAVWMPLGALAGVLGSLFPSWAFRRDLSDAIKELNEVLMGAPQPT